MDYEGFVGGAKLQITSFSKSLRPLKGGADQVAAQGAAARSATLRRLPGVRDSGLGFSLNPEGPTAQLMEL